MPNVVQKDVSIKAKETLFAVSILEIKKYRKSIYNTNIFPSQSFAYADSRLFL